MICTIEWNRLSLEEWQARFAPIRRSTLFQDYDYARAACPVYGQRAQWGLIKIDGVEAGIVQMLEARLFGRMLHAMTIDRGPLWFAGFGGVAHIRAFFDTINTQFPARFGRRRRLIPELPDSPVLRAMLGQAGLILRSNDYGTTWLDLTRTMDDLRARLGQDWAHRLSKGEKESFAIDFSVTPQAIDDVIQGYVADRIMNPYPGLDQKLVRGLADVFSKTGKLVIGRVMAGNKTVAASLILCHGCAATYLIGWSDAQGLEVNAQYPLLWAAIQTLKDNGIKDFDLGSIHENSMAGGSPIKDGIGGIRVQHAGLYG